MAFYYGTDYYPEHWPRDRWETDAKLMEEMGIDVVRMAEFSWAKMEPREGEFHFEWLKEAVALLAKHGIKSILGTPTAAPPAWIIEKNPEIQPIPTVPSTFSAAGTMTVSQMRPTGSISAAL